MIRDLRLIGWLPLLSVLGLVFSTHAAAPKSVDTIVAIVNEDIILRSELDRFLAQVLRQLRITKTTVPPKNILEKQALDRLVLLKLQLQLADNTGIRVDDEAVNQALTALATQNKMTLVQFRQRLSKEGFDFAEFRDNLRNEIILGRLHQRNVHNRIQISKEEIDGFLATQTAEAAEAPKVKRNDRFRLQHILIALPENAPNEVTRSTKAKAQKILEQLHAGKDFAELAVRHSNGQHALQGGTIGWFGLAQLPRHWFKAVTNMRVGQISPLISTPSGFHILKVLGTQGGVSATPAVTQTKVRHILIRTTELISDDDAKNRLTRIRERLSHGESFDELAKAHSDDAYSSRNGGDLGWLSTGMVVAQFEKEMDSAQKSQVTAPFKSEYGWHILEVTDRKQDSDPKEHRRNVVKSMLRARKQRESLEAWLRQLRDEAYVEYRIDS